MNKKLAYLLAMLMITLGSFCSCSQNESQANMYRDWDSSFDRMESSKNTWASYVAGTFLDNLALTENVDFDAMTAYDYEIVSARLNNDSFPEFSSTRRFIQQYHNDFPIQRIEAIDESHVCVVYKLTDDAGDTVYSYTIFERIVENIVTDSQNTESTETWKMSGECYYVSASFSKDDYGTIKLGDNYEKFVAIDPAIKYDYSNMSNYIVGGFTSYRLLEDGLLVVEFEDQDPTFNEDNVYIPSDPELFSIKSMRFYSWGTEDAFDAHPILRAEVNTITLP